MAYKAADEEARSHHKRRTPRHKKHTLYPGMTLSPKAIVVSGSIKSGGSPHNIPAQASKGSLDPLWNAYFDAAKKCGSYGSAMPLQMRRKAEDDYVHAFLRLVKAGKADPIKRKYTAR
jgi:hypothetical protein